MSIGFYGDSYCATIGRDSACPTYLKRLATHYNTNIVHTGHPGSSVGDVILTQLPSLPHPDICIFVWTDVARLFHSEIRTINAASANQSSGDIWDAAKQYYKYLYDHCFATIQYRALLEYIDNHVLSKFSEHIKIIHLWAFDPQPEYYRWKTGVEIRPALHKVATAPVDPMEQVDNLLATSPNHLGGVERNTLVFDWIKEAIDNYASGTLLTKEINYEQH